MAHIYSVPQLMQSLALPSLYLPTYVPTYFTQFLHKSELKIKDVQCANSLELES